MGVQSRGRKLYLSWLQQADDAVYDIDAFRVTEDFCGQCVPSVNDRSVGTREEDGHLRWPEATFYKEGSL